jgi:NAD(P)-dependent dehydrogenase (short-subunit alcohol dehydrogenase family)
VVIKGVKTNYDRICYSRCRTDEFGDCEVARNKNLQEGIEVVDEIKKIGQRALHIQADVSDPDQVEEMIERVIRLFK